MDLPGAPSKKSARGHECLFVRRVSFRKADYRCLLAYQAHRVCSFFELVSHAVCFRRLFVLSPRGSPIEGLLTIGLTCGPAEGLGFIGLWLGPGGPSSTRVGQDRTTVLLSSLLNHTKNHPRSLYESLTHAFNNGLGFRV